VLWLTLRKLKSPQAALRRQAVTALGRSKDARAVGPLLSALTDDDEGVRDRAAKALSNNDPNWFRSLAAQQAVVGLRGDVKRGEEGSRVRALRALGEIGTPEALGAVVEALVDEVPAVREAAQKALQKSNANGTHLEVVREGLPQLIGALKHESADVRFAGAQALQRIADSNAVPELIHCLQDASSRVRQAAASALGQANDTRALAPLIAALDEIEPSVLEAVGSAIERFGGTAIPSLVQAARHSDRIIRFNASLILERLGWEPTDPAERAWHAVARGRFDEALKEGTLAVEPLMRASDVRPPDASPLPPSVGANRPPWLQERMEGDASTQVAASRALLKIDRTLGMERLVSLLDDANPMAREEAARALGDVGDTRAVLPLLRARKDMQAAVRVEAADALLKIKEPRVLEVLVESLPDPSLRSAAADTLRDMKDSRAVDLLVPLVNRAPRRSADRCPVRHGYLRLRELFSRLRPHARRRQALCRRGRSEGCADYRRHELRDLGAGFLR